ncbi:MAG TPA: GNAT family N-acetyltransferase [Caulobacteraceae bacterium]|nr:GNAT family N-acetyltransferase [Caulobacteraceae bacterium]
MQAGIEIARLSASPATVAALAELLIETVASGGSVSFMHPLAPDQAADFWTRSLAAADAGKRVVLGARLSGELAGTVTLDLETPQNQPHRADIAKLMTRVRDRRRGVGSALMLEAERIAAERGRTLLTLDTAAEDGAAPLYERLGFEFAGAIPDYAFKPLGGLTGTLIYFKRIGGAAGASQGSR